MVATLVSVPRTLRAASSHSSLTSTVMRVMLWMIHQDLSGEDTKSAQSRPPSEGGRRSPGGARREGAWREGAWRETAQAVRAPEPCSVPLCHDERTTTEDRRATAGRCGTGCHGGWGARHDDPPGRREGAGRAAAADRSAAGA